MLLQGATRDPRGRLLLWRWLQVRFEALVARLPRGYPLALGDLAASLCDAGELPAIERFLDERVRSHEGGPRRAALALEHLRLCVAYRAAQAPIVAAYFSRSRAKAR